MNNNILEIDDLHVSFNTFEGDFTAVNGISLGIKHNESIGIIGESGCGKSTLSFAIMNYVAKNATVHGEIRFKGEDMLSMNDHQLRSIRGNRIAMVYQNPYSSLNPARTIGFQLDEVGIFHQNLTKEEAKEASLEALTMLNIADPEGVVSRYPHQVSGGIQQRICIAMAILCRPDVMILDEPTTALDVTTEAVILDTISKLRKQLNMSMMYISHDMGVINKVADTIVVMYNGEIVESGPKVELFDSPLHPYTRSLINCLPRGGVVKEKARLHTIKGYVRKRGAHETGCPFRERCEKYTPTCEERYYMREISDKRYASCDRAYATDVPSSDDKKKPIEIKEKPSDVTKPLLTLHNIHKYYPNGKKRVYAVNGVDVEIPPSSVLGIVGESGCGKSTIGHMISGLYPPTHGEMLFKDQNISIAWNKRSHDVLKEIQLIFQNPGRSLNPSHTVEQLISRPMKVLSTFTNKEQRTQEIERVLKRVDLGKEYLSKKPQQLSGGEQQRVALARALITHPSLLVCDEVTSALDVSVQASVLNLLHELQSETGSSYVFISHDLHVINYLSDYILVLYSGKVCEHGLRDDVMNNPKHPYTEALLSARGEVDPKVKRQVIDISGELPDPTKQGVGCPFASRCHKKVGPICDTEYPATVVLDGGHYYNCHIKEAVK